MGYNQKEVLNNNIASIELALQYKTKYRELPKYQVNKLLQFGGWGGCKVVLLDPYTDEQWETASQVDKGLRESVRELHEVLKENLPDKEYTEAVDSIKNATLSSFYTPAVLPHVFYETLKDYAQVETILDPSAGAGIFVTEAMKVLGEHIHVDAYEKDKLTGRVLHAIVSNAVKNGVVYVKGFETSGNEEDTYDVVTSNVPFGAISVFDPTAKTKEEKDYCKKLHNYFFWKGLQKVQNGGLLAYVVTNAFLDTVSNRSIREYVFSNSDFISLVVLPDNMFKESANTEAPSHFLVVRKNSSKTEMSEEEKLLCVSEMHTSGGVTFALNKYCQKMCGDVVIGNVQIGKNQYGKPNREVWWDGDIEAVGPVFSEMLRRDFETRYKKPLTTKDVIGAGEMIWDDQIVDIPENEEDELLPWEEDNNGLTEEEEEERQIELYEQESGEDYYQDDVETDRKLLEDNDEIPWEIEERTFKQAGLTSIPEIVPTPETTDKPQETAEFIDNLFNENTVEFKPGVIMSRKICRKDLFTDEEELVQVVRINKDGSITHVPVQLKGKEGEILQSYIKIRDLYIQLEKMENQQI